MNCNYYTPIKLAECILNLVPNYKFKTVIDICCGSSNLLKAAYNKWPNSILFGVDIDSNAFLNKHEGFNYLNQDGRIFSIDQFQKNNTYDLILSNPPFGRLQIKKSVIIRKETEKYKQFLNGRYENEMILANMLLAHERSVLIAILPSTFLEGTSNLISRKIMFENFIIHAIVELPRNTFYGCVVRSHALVMERVMNSEDFVTRYYLAHYHDNSDWNITYQFDLIKNDLQSGSWINSSLTTFSYRDDLYINRGNISSNMFSEEGKVVYHCSSQFKDGMWFPSIKHTNLATEKNRSSYALKGDILINRIGKSSGYWCINKKAKVLISDCLVVVKNVNQEVINKLEHSSSNGRLNIPQRGVAARFITIEDIKGLLS